MSPCTKDKPFLFKENVEPLALPLYDISNNHLSDGWERREEKGKSIQGGGNRDRESVNKSMSGFAG
jgi:hypothetical protein